MKDNTTLYVHSIESFSTLDGPGIRYVIFLQGCSFRCRYCHNPDTWKKNTGKKMNIINLFSEIKKNQNYLRPNRGGITFSGGEPLEQAGNILPLFEEIKNIKLTTCLDTAGYRLDSPVKELLKNTDLVLLDLKQSISNKHRELTGKDNASVFEFQDYLDNMKIPYWIRFTCVKDINDDNATLEALKGRLINRCSLEKIEVLPYHNMGIQKWDSLGIEYTLREIKPSLKKETQKIETYLNSYI